MRNQGILSRCGLGSLLLPAVALALLIGVGSARAGSLDMALLEHSGDVLEFIKDKGWQNVGVLPFKVQRGARTASFSGGPLSHNITRRLENALILSMGSNEKKAVGIIRDATTTANKAKVGSYLTNPISFRKLFATKYELAWGGKTVKPDCFLTGSVVNSGNRGKTKVTIYAIDANSRKTGKVLGYKVKEFEVRTDRMLAADLGYNFALARSRAVKRGVTPLKRDQVVMEEITLEDEQGLQPTDPLQSKQHTPVNIAGFAFELHYNGEKQELMPLTQGKGAQSPEYRAPAAPPGSAVNIYLTRINEEDVKLGLVMMINGRSSWAEETGDPLQCRKWIYSPERTGIRDNYEGFYYDVKGRNLRRFKVLSAEESEVVASELGAKAGWIEVYVFASREGGKQDPEMMVSLRGIPKSRTMSLASLQTALMKKSNLKLKERTVTKRDIGGLIVNELEPEEGGEISTDDLPYPELIGHLAIRYWEGGGKQVTP